MIFYYFKRYVKRGDKLRAKAKQKEFADSLGFANVKDEDEMMDEDFNPNLIQLGVKEEKVRIIRDMAYTDYL